MAARNRRHPAEKALNVWKAPRAKDKRQPPGPKYLDPQQEDGMVFSRLIKSYNLLSDPMEKIIYPGLKRKRPLNSTIHKGAFHVIKNDPITVPTCCTDHQQEVSEIVDEHRAYLYNSPSPTLPYTAHTKDRDRLEHLSAVNLRNSRRQLPYSTVVVRWRSNDGAPQIRGYDTDALYDIMSEFGPITSIYITSPSTAYVVFLNLSDSCDAISVRSLGRSDNRLYCYWLHHNMANKLFYLSKNGVRVSYNQFVLPTG